MTGDYSEDLNVSTHKYSHARYIYGRMLDISFGDADLSDPVSPATNYSKIWHSMLELRLPSTNLSLCFLNNQFL